VKRPRDPGVFLLQKASTRSGLAVHVRRQGGRQIEDDRGVFNKTGGAWFRFRAGIPSAWSIVRPSLVRRRSSVVVVRSSFVRRRRCVRSSSFVRRTLSVRFRSLVSGARSSLDG
jgi:hypothetical protein